MEQHFWNQLSFIWQSPHPYPCPEVAVVTIPKIWLAHFWFPPTTPSHISGVARIAISYMIKSLMRLALLKADQVLSINNHKPMGLMAHWSGLWDEFRWVEYGRGTRYYSYVPCKHPIPCPPSYFLILITTIMIWTTPNLLKFPSTSPHSSLREGVLTS